MMKPKPRVALLSGGLSSEDYLSRRSVAHIHENLQSVPYEINILDWHKEGQVTLHRQPDEKPVKSWPDLLNCFREFKPDVVFNCLHGERENAGQLQGFFEILGFPITGNELAPSVIGMDKMLSKDLFRRMEIPTPDNHFLGYLREFDPREALDEIRNLHRHFELEFPIMLKASRGGSSEGVALAESEAAYENILDEWTENPITQYCPIFLEKYIRGREYCIGVFGHWNKDALVILPAAEIKFRGKLFDKETKYSNDYDVEINPDISPELLRRMQYAAREVQRALRFSGFSRMDFIADNAVPYALEVNTHPGMGRMSIIPKMLKKCHALEIRNALIRMIEWAIADSKRTLH